MALALCDCGIPVGGFPHAWPSAWIRTAARWACYAYALAVPWLSPATIAVIRANAPRVAQQFRIEHGAAYLVAAVAAGFLLAAWAMARMELAPATRFALLMSYLVRGYGAGPLLVPAFAGAAAGTLPPGNGHGVLGGGWHSWRGRWSRGFRGELRGAWGSPRSLPAYRWWRHQRRAAREMEQAHRHRTTIEYKTAKWLEAGLPGAAGVRSRHASGSG